MANAVIRLDKSKTFSECRGERAPDDPDYRVAFRQGQRVGDEMVLLPFDANGELVPDDGKTQPYAGIVDSKPVMHHPLYTAAMRALVERKMQRLKSAEPTPDAGDEDESRSQNSLVEDVNFVSWLRGEVRYDWALLQVAAKARFSRVFTSKRELVTDLVLDEKLIPEAQVGADLAKLLPSKVDA